MTLSGKLRRLSRRYPWPESRTFPALGPLDYEPNVVPTDFLAFEDADAAPKLILTVHDPFCELARAYLRKLPDVVVVGLDSWSDRRVIRDLRAAAVTESDDDVAGSGRESFDVRFFEALVQTHGVFQVGLHNVREFSARFIPVRSLDPDPIRVVRELDIQPDLIYLGNNVDGRTITEFSRLFPEAGMLGVGWRRYPEKRARRIANAVYQLARRREVGLGIARNGHWVIARGRRAESSARVSIGIPSPRSGAGTSPSSGVIRSANDHQTVSFDRLSLESLSPARDQDQLAGARLPRRALSLRATGGSIAQRLVSEPIVVKGRAGAFYQIRFRVFPVAPVTRVGVRITFDIVTSLKRNIAVVPGRWQTVAAVFQAPLDHDDLQLFVYPTTTADDDDDRKGLRAALAKVDFSSSTARDAERVATLMGAAGVGPKALSFVNDFSPIFIVGCGHSGTTLLAAMLDSHSNILSYPGESYAFFDDDWADRFPRLLELAEAAGKSGLSRICEKTPSHCRHIKRIFAALPASRVIYMVRDGRDVAVSMERRNGSLEQGAEMWIEQNSIGLEQMKETERVLLVRYEDLVADPQAVLRGICAFVGEGYEKSMLNFHRVERRWYGIEKLREERLEHEVGISNSEQEDRHIHRRNWQIHQPIFDGRGEARKLPRKHWTELTTRMGKLLGEFGYE